jgi:FlgD Ig-like domain
MRPLAPRFLSLVVAALAMFASTTARAGGAITSGSTVAGSVAGPTFSETWTFTGNTNDEVVFTAVTTSGALNTNLVLKAPGGAVVSTTTTDRTDFKLTSSGTWTIVISDAALANAGNYNLTLIDLAGTLNSGGDSDGGAIASGQILTGTTNAASDLDAYTFSGTTGDRVVLTFPATSSTATYNTAVYLYPPGGGTFVTASFGDRLEYQLAATGTYKVVVQDQNLVNTGTFAISFLNVTAGPLTTVSDMDGGAILSGSIASGTMSGPGDLDGFTFTGTNGDHVILAAISTSGALNTNINLYPPGGGAPIVATSSDRNDATLTATGTWTVVIEDASDTQAGGYNLSLLDLSSTLTSGSDLDGGPITSNQIISGTTNVPGDLDAFTFSGTTGDRVILTFPATSGTPYNSSVYLYPPGGGTFVTASFGDRLEYQLAATGTFTAVVQDQNMTNAGTYVISYLNVTAGPLTSGSDLDGGPIVSGSIKSGTMSGPGDLDGFTFTGNSGEHVILAAIATSGALNTNINLYPPGGGAPIVATSTDRNDATLNASGTWTVVIEDLSDAQTGGYNLSLLDLSGTLTSGSDLDGGPITSNQIISGTTNVLGDLDAFTFSGTTGDRIILTFPATSGASYNSSVYLYPPGGGSFVMASFGDRLEYQLAATGTFTAVVQDQNMLHSGTYAISYLNVTAGPLTTVSDMDGGPIVSGSIKSGTMSGPGDLDGFTFTGNSGDHVILAAVTSAGALNTNISLYPPGGGAPIVATSSDRNDATLNASGTWTVVIEDLSDAQTGGYNLSLLDLSGTLTSGSDPDGGPITSNQIISGTTNVPGDLDAFTFSGTTGDRIILTFPATSGASYNSAIYLYPPGGGSFVMASFGDRLEYQLAATGTFTAVVQDQNMVNSGTYAISYLNVTAGPLTSGSDLDGGPILSGSIKTGTMSGPGDLDGFTFTGNSGDHVILGAVTTAGALNTNVNLYPPGGGAPIVATSTDRNDATLNASGTWTVVVEDISDAQSGTYSLSVLDLSSTLTSAGDPDGGSLASNQIINGTTNAIGDFDAYLISGAVGDRIVITAPATGGGGSYNTSIWLYPSGGGSYVAVTFGDRLEYQLTTSAAYVVVIQDQSLANTGTYALSYMDVTSGPFTSVADTSGGAMFSSTVRTGNMSGPGDMDAYTFNGNAGEHVLIAAVTSGGALNTNISLYPPGGGPAILQSSADRGDATLTASGRWTILIEDISDANPGNYSLSLLDLSGQLTSLADPDGGALYSNQVRAGSTNVIADLDAFTFSGLAGDRVVMNAVATGGDVSYNTALFLYPPGGGTYVTASFGDRIDYQLASSGTYVLVVQDQSLLYTGTYSVSLLNVLAGAVQTPADMEGGQIKPGDVKTGQISPLNDFDGYWFTGNAGETAHLTATTTSGTLNTYTSIYPPGGGGALLASSGDVSNFLLPVTGRYAVVIEDLSDSHTGGYTLSLTGPLTTTDAPPTGPLDPTRVVLEASRPNPALGPATLTFSLPTELPVEMRIYDIRGALVRTIVRGTLAAGTHTRTWDGRDERGQRVHAGVYFTELHAGDQTLRKSLVRLE